MNLQDRTKAMVESGLITSLASVFILGGIYIPLLGYGLLLIPVPFIIISTKHGIKYSLLSVVATSLIVGSLTEPLTALFVLLIAGLGPIIMGHMIKRDYSYGKVLIFSALAFILSMSISISLMTVFTGVSMIDMIQESFTMSKEMNESLFKGLGVDSIKADEAMEMVERAKNLAIMLIPSSIIAGGFMVSYINYLASRAILKRMGINIIKPTKFTHFRLPRNIVMGTLIILILTYIAGMLNIVNYDTLMTNVIYLFSMLYLIQGLAAINYYMETKGLGKIVRLIISIIVMGMPTLSFSLIFIGLFDVILNIRKL